MRSVAVLFALGASILIAFPMVSAYGQNQNTQSRSASGQVEDRQDHFHGGSRFTLRLHVDEPVPEGATIRLIASDRVQYAPVFAQGEPQNKERTVFLFQVNLPAEVLPGEWHIASISVTAGQFDSQLATNDVSFVVEGRKPNFPSKGTIELEDDRR